MNTSYVVFLGGNSLNVVPVEGGQVNEVDVAWVQDAINEKNRRNTEAIVNRMKEVGLA